MDKPEETAIHEPSINLFNKLIKYILILADIAGANVVKPSYSLVQAIPVIFVTYLFVFAYLYNVLTDMPLNEMIQGLTIIIISLQGMTKLYGILTHRQIIVSMITQLRKLHEENVSQNRNQGPLLLCVQRCYICYKIFMLSYFGVIICYDLLPLFIHLYYHKRVLIIPVHLPALNVDTTFGYTINMILQLTFTTYGGTGILAADMTFLILVIHSTALVSHFKYVFDDVNEIIDDSSSAYDAKKLRGFLREAWAHHLGIIKYIRDLNEIFSMPNLFQLVSCALALTLTLFLFVWERWIVGPFLVVAILFQLFEYCILGTIVQVQNEKIAKIIYSCTWYKLETIEQKQILMMMVRAQNPSELNAGQFTKLNVQTCMQVLKATYSYFMMILEFLSGQNSL